MNSTEKEVVELARPMTLHIVPVFEGEEYDFGQLDHADTIRQRCISRLRRRSEERLMRTFEEVVPASYWAAKDWHKTCVDLRSSVVSFVQTSWATKD
jgi:hypothetical protein